MEKLRKIVKREMDVDYLATVHAMSMVFCYGCLMYFSGSKAVSFAIIFEIYCLAYFIAWTQKLLFIEERVYQSKEFCIRTMLWLLLPTLWEFAGGRVFHWYNGAAAWVEPSFYILMLCYYVIVYWSVRVFYKDETKEMNSLLEQYKKRKDDTHEGNHSDH